MSDKDYLIKGEMYQYNLGWLIQELLSFKQDLATAIDLKTIKYADPIQWDITTQYPANTVVVDPKSGTAYMSKVPVPAGVELTNTNYWVVVFNYQDIYNKIMDGVAFNDRDQDYATKDLFVNDLVWYAGNLYRVTRAIPTGSKYIPNTNLIKTSIESLLDQYYGRDRTAQVSNDTVNVSGDYTLIAGNIAETSTNRTVKVTKDREIDVDGSDSVHIDGVSTVNVGGLRTEVYAGDKTEKVTGTATEEYTGTHTENHAGKKIVNATDIVLNPTEPLTYGTPEKLNDYFNSIPLKDCDGNIYKVLVDKHPLPLPNETLNICYLSGGVSVNYGFCCVIYNDNFVGVIDFGTQPDAIYLRNWLKSRNLTKINFVAITHYHDDHIGGGDGVKAFFNDTDLNFTDCHVYLPHKNIVWDNLEGTTKTLYQKMESDIKNLLTNKNIAWSQPSNGEIVTISNNTAFSFFNTDPAYYDDYYKYTVDAYNITKDYTNYNNFSMIVVLNHYKNKAVFTSDIEYLAEKNNYNVFENVNVFTVEHHGQNYNSYVGYLSALVPKYAIIPTYDTWNYDTQIEATMNNLLAKGVELFITGTNGDTYISMSGYGVSANADKGHAILPYGGLLNSVGYQFLSGDDLDNFKTPGKFWSQNLSMTNTLKNVPPLIGGGFTMDVIKPSGSAVIIQKITVFNTITQAIITRQFYDGEWHNWKYLLPSNYNYKELTASDFLVNATPNVDDHQTRIYFVNNILNISLNFTANETISPSTPILTIGDYYPKYFTTNFVMSDTTGKTYTFRLLSNNNLVCMQEITSGTRILGNVTMPGYIY